MLVCALKPSTSMKGGSAAAALGDEYQRMGNQVFIPILLPVLLEVVLNPFADMDRFWDYPYGGRPVSSMLIPWNAFSWLCPGSSFV